MRPTVDVIETRAAAPRGVPHCDGPFDTDAEQTVAAFLARLDRVEDPIGGG